MACFTLGTLENILIWLVIFGAVWALIKLLLPFVIGPLGEAGNVITQALNIVFWAAVAIFVIVLIFSLIGCLIGAGGVRLPRF